MGCGSSSLKGDPVGTDLNSTPNVPVNTAAPNSSKNALTKTPTQFNSVDYDAERKKSVMPPDRAPHEPDSPRLPKSTNLPATDEAKEDAYHTPEDPAAVGSQVEGLDHSYPHEHVKGEEPELNSSPDQLDAQTAKEELAAGKGVEQDIVR